MKNYFYAGISILIISIISSALAEPVGDIDKLITETDPQQQEILIEMIINAEPDWKDIISQIQNITFEPATQTGAMLKKTTCIDEVERPWVFYAPENYNPAKPTPLVVWLHGGVSRAEVIEEPLTYLDGHDFQELAEKMGWFMIYPMGQFGATWWDSVGMANIKNLVRTV
jgi:hypothetical protein